jgi:hypothetical protein
MKVLMQTLLVSALLVAALPAAHASPYGSCDGFWGKMSRIERRIERGVADCRLTYGEERRLSRQQRRIKQLFRELREDGDLSRRDCRTLNDRVARLSDRVRRMKHNDVRCDDGHDRHSRRDRY